MTTIEVLMPSQITELEKNPCHPPRKIRENKADINIMLAYSARKSRANDIEEYSTL